MPVAAAAGHGNLRRLDFFIEIVSLNKNTIPTFLVNNSLYGVVSPNR